MSQENVDGVAAVEADADVDAAFTVGVEAVPITVAPDTTNVAAIT